MFNRNRSYSLYLLAIPGIIYLFINNYMPLPGLVLAFKRYNVARGVFGSKWVGLKNFQYLFFTADAIIITRNTLLYNFVFISLGTCMSVLVAIMLSEVKKDTLRKIFQSLLLFPYLLSWVIVSYIVYAFLATDTGFLNNSLANILDYDKVIWYNKKEIWPLIIVFVYLWKNIGYTSIIYYASIASIDPVFFEAAEIDGANKIQQIIKITLPFLKKTIIVVLLLSLGRVMYSDFGLFYQVPRNLGVLFSVTNTIDTYVYRGLVELGDITMSAAAGVYQSFIGFLLVITVNWILKKYDSESALF